MPSGEHPITVTQFDEEGDEIFLKQLEKNAEEEKTSSNGQGQGSNPVTKIQKVPDVMKAETNKLLKEDYFAPKAIAIGPIHAHSKNVFVGEALKWKWAAKYLNGLNGKKILQEIRVEIKSLMENFDKNCLDNDENTLARMLFVDGCAMLQFIYSFAWDDDFVKQLKINPAQATLVQQDLFLLENQIPFRVLQIIMKGGPNYQQKEKEEEKKIKSDCEKLTTMEKAVQKFKSDSRLDSKILTNMETAVEMFIHLSNMSTASRPDSSLKFDGVVHLLDLLRRSLLDDSAQSDVFSKSAFNCLLVKFPVFIIFKLPLYVLCFPACLAATIVVTFIYIIYRFIHFLKRSANPPSSYLDLVCWCLFIIGFCLGFVGFLIPKSPITRRTFRNVQELKAAGIELKPSKSRCLKEVSFSSGLFGGCLRLCPILVDKSTAGKLLNLIAYEMCPDYHCKITEDSKNYDYRISSYLSFLDSLIDNERDVKDLRAANILRHRLSSDAEVAELFNNISLNSVADDAYGDVNSKIQEYYDRKIRIWITDFRHEHLSSPWTLLALIAAAAALGLTAAQTYFTINPR